MVVEIVVMIMEVTVMTRRWCWVPQMNWSLTSGSIHLAPSRGAGGDSLHLHNGVQSSFFLRFHGARVELGAWLRSHKSLLSCWPGAGSLRPLCPQNNPPFPCCAGLPQKRVLEPSHRLACETLVTPGCLFHRGNSKYHYYGIRLKPDSPLNRLQEDTQYMAMRQQPLHQKPRWVASAGPS